MPDPTTIVSPVSPPTYPDDDPTSFQDWWDNQFGTNPTGAGAGENHVEEDYLPSDEDVFEPPQSTTLPVAAAAVNVDAALPTEVEVAPSPVNHVQT